MSVGDADTEGFDEFVDASARSLQRAAWLLTTDWASAEDLVQTSLVITWQHWVRARQAPTAYTHRVMTRTYLRGQRRRWTGEAPTASLPETPNDDASDEVAVGVDVRGALSALTPQQRVAIVCRYFADLTAEQTAAAMGCSVGTVKSHIARALAKLRQHPSVSAILEGGVSR